MSVASWRRSGGRATSFLAMDVGSPEPRPGWVQNQGFEGHWTLFRLFEDPDPGSGKSTLLAENDGARPPKRLWEAEDTRNRSERSQGSARDTPDRSAQRSSNSLANST